MFGVFASVFLKLVLNFDVLFCRRRISVGMRDYVIYHQVQHLDWNCINCLFGIGVEHCEFYIVQEL